MQNFDVKKAVLKLINSNKKGVAKETIIEYLDYVNKVRYTDSEIVPILTELKEQNKIKLENQLWVSVT